MLPSVVRAYAEEGYRFRMGSPRMYTTGVHRIGAATFPTDAMNLPLNELGFTLTDFHFFELAAQEVNPKAGLVIGNAFGISTICLAEALRPISIDAIDAEVMGSASAEGADLTRRVATRLELDVRVTRGFSPRDLDAACRHGKYGLVFIDGLHTNAQIIADFLGVADRLADRCAVVFHDVGLCNMDEGWAEIRRLARPMGLQPFDLTFTDYGVTALLRTPELEQMLSRTCPRLREFNEVYEIGSWWHRPGSRPEKQVHFVGHDRTIAFYGAGRDLELYRPFIEENPHWVCAILDDDRSKWRTEKFGVPVVEPAELPMLGVDAVVISSRANEARVRERLSRMASGVAVLPAPGWPFEVELHVQEAPMPAMSA